jgi:hypothetical protein
MTEPPDAEITAAQWVRALARARGLDRAQALYPEAVVAAVARGTASLSPLLADFSPVTEPAAVFDPGQFANQAGPGNERNPGTHT